MTKRTKKLSLSKETVRNLSNASLGEVNGGLVIAYSGKVTCAKTCACNFTGGGLSFVAGDCGGMSIFMPTLCC